MIWNYNLLLLVTILSIVNIGGILLLFWEIKKTRTVLREYLIASGQIALAGNLKIMEALMSQEKYKGALDDLKDMIE